MVKALASTTTARARAAAADAGGVDVAAAAAKAARAGRFRPVTSRARPVLANRCTIRRRASRKRKAASSRRKLRHRIKASLPAPVTKAASRTPTVTANRDAAAAAGAADGVIAATVLLATAISPPARVTKRTSGPTLATAPIGRRRAR